MFLFPTPIAQGDVEDCLPRRNVDCLNQCACFVVEELRTARRFLRKAGYNRSFDETEFFILNEHTKDEVVKEYLRPLRKGKNVGVMSEAGLPCVADPGARFVALCQREGFEVVPFVGPCSLMMALMSSGFNGQSFAFVGYLPVERSARMIKIRNLESMAYRFAQTQIFIEAPYRNNHLFASLLEVCKAETLLCVAADIGEESMEIRTKTISSWRKEGIDLNKRNTVFLISKQ